MAFPLSQPINPRPLSVSPDALQSLQGAAAARESASAAAAVPASVDRPSSINIPNTASRYDLGKAFYNSTPEALDKVAQGQANAARAAAEAPGYRSPYDFVGASNPNPSSKYFNPLAGGPPDAAVKLPSSLDTPPVRGIPLERLGGPAGLAGIVGAGIDLGIGLLSGRNLADALAHSGAVGTGVAIGVLGGNLAGGAIGSLLGPGGTLIGAYVGAQIGGLLGASIADGIYNWFHPRTADRNPRQPQQNVPIIPLGIVGARYAIVGQVPSLFNGKLYDNEGSLDLRTFIGPVFFFAGAGSIINAVDSIGFVAQVGGHFDGQPAGSSLRLVRLDQPVQDVPVRDPHRTTEPGEQSPIRVPVIPAARPKGAPNPTTQPTLPPIPEIQPQVRPGGPSPSGVPNQNPVQAPGDSPSSTPGQSPSSTPGQSPSSTPGQSPSSTPGGSPSSSPYPTPTPYPTTPYPTPAPYPSHPTTTPKAPQEGNTPDSLLPYLPLALIPFAVRPAPGETGKTQQRLNSQNPEASPVAPGDGPPVKGPPESPCKSGCGAALANQLNGIDSKLAAANAAGQDAALAAILAKLAVIDAKLGLQAVGGLSGFLANFREGFDKLAKWLQLDRALAVMTFAISFHNAYMLSNQLSQTLFSMISNVLAAIGLKDHEGNPLQIGSVIGKSLEGLAASMLGAATVDGIKAEWKKYNRIYQAAANVLWSLQSITSSITAGLEVVGSYVGKIGNALQKWRVIGEKAYGWMNPQPNFQNRFFTALETTQNVVSQIDQVATEVLSVETTIENIGKQTADIQKALKEDEGSKPGTATPEAAKVAAAAAASKKVSLTPDIPIETQAKPEG